jgi:hypothetical protein
MKEPFLVLRQVAVQSSQEGRIIHPVSGFDQSSIFGKRKNVVQCQESLREEKEMPILKDIPIALTPQEIIASRAQGRIRPALIQDAQEAITLGHTLWRPKAVYDWFDVLCVEGDTVILSTPGQASGESMLHVGRKADLLEGANRVLVSICTIGPVLEQRVHELNTEREGLKAYMLDSAGVVALGAVGEAVRCLAEEAAAEQGWGVSPSLSPGSLVGWTLRGQREVCALLPMESIGVRLNSHCVLEPHKSTSTVIGLGPGYDTKRVGSVCKYCALAKTCWRRREEPS